ncbi:unnamed protein product [Ectocarpus fasciculatus]
MGTCLSSPPEEPASIKRLRRSSRGSGDAVWVSKSMCMYGAADDDAGAAGAWDGGGLIMAGNVDLLRNVVCFVAEKQFLFFAPVSRAWREAWGHRPAITSWVTEDSSVSQLRYSFERGLPRDRPELCAAIARLGNLELLRSARGSGCVWNGLTFSEAARRGDLAFLQWLKSSGCTWDKFSAIAAAGGGHLHVLKWLRKSGVGWDDDEWTCHMAAAGGHVHVLRWAIQNGCRYDNVTCWSAAHQGHLEALKYLRKVAGCGWDRQRCFDAAVRGGHRRVAEWIVAN